MQTMDLLVGGRSDDVWDERWRALSLAIDTMFNDYGQVPDAPRLKTLRPLLLCLKEFAGKRLADFHSGFLTRCLQTWPDFPPDAVLSIIQDQVGFDIAVIDRALLQRVAGTSLMKERLELVDRLAWSALQLAVSAGLLRAERLPTVVTYFQKSPDMRVIPYAPVALLGIPYSCQQLDRDLLATPHEVGHYVFGHATYEGQPLRKYLLNRLNQIVPDTRSQEYRRLLRWLEEIFADVYGVCVVGPVMALDFQDLQLHASRRGFITDDNDHPAPVLRPRIHLQALRKRNPADWAAWAAVLERIWALRLQERERIDRLDDLDATDRARTLDYFVSDNQPIAVAQTISGASSSAEDARPLDRLVTVILEVLRPGNTLPWYDVLPAAPAAEPQSLQREALAPIIEQLYQSLGAFVLRPPLVEADTLDPLSNAVLTTPAGRASAVRQWLDAKLMTFPSGQVAIEDWAPFFDAEGWTIEGPNTWWP